MDDLRPYYSTRQVIDVDSYLSERDTHYLFCISKANLHALRVMAKTRLLWPTTWAKERYDQLYKLPEADDWDAIDAHVSEFIQASEVVEMCNNALIDALEGIASAINLSACCEGAGPGGQQIGNDFYFGTEAPLSEPTVFGPGEEFETEEAYQAHKCATANAIVNALIGSLNGMSILTLGSLVVGSVAVAVIGIGLLTVPPIAVLLALVATGLAFSLLAALASEIETYKQELVCILYNSGSATSAYNSFRDYIGELAIDIGVLEVQVGVINDVIMNLCPIDTMNALFQSVGLPVVGGDIIDCAACQAGTDWQLIWGTAVGQDLSRNTTGFVLTSELLEVTEITLHRIRIVPPSGTCWNISVSISPSWVPTTQGIKSLYIDCAGTPVVYPADPNDPPNLISTCVKGGETETEARVNLSGRETAQYTATFTINSECT